MTSLWADLRFSLRGLRRNPLFSTVAILSLALGIGANTAIFTVMDQLMLRELPVRDATCMPGPFSLLRSQRHGFFSDDLAHPRFHRSGWPSCHAGFIGAQIGA